MLSGWGKPVLVYLCWGNSLILPPCLSRLELVQTSGWNKSKINKHYLNEIQCYSVNKLTHCHYRRWNVNDCNVLQWNILTKKLMQIHVRWVKILMHSNWLYQKFNKKYTLKSYIINKWHGYYNDMFKVLKSFIKTFLS